MGRRAAPGRGAITIGKDSSLRKLMRATRRGKQAPWWLARPEDVKRMLRRYKQAENADVRANGGGEDG